MKLTDKPAPIIILNGAPRSGKSSIVSAIQDMDARPWMNLGVDTYVRAATPQRYRPGIGLRPGGERPDLEPLVPVFYAALYASIAAHSRLGLPVVAEFGHHDAYSQPLGILKRCARLLAGLPVTFVGVQCPLDVVIERRQAESGERVAEYQPLGEDGTIPPAILSWQDEVHYPGDYDLEVDTSVLSPEACAAEILARVREPGEGQGAFARIALSSSRPTMPGRRENI